MSFSRESSHTLYEDGSYLPEDMVPVRLKNKRKRAAPIPQRNPPIVPPLQLADRYEMRNIILRPGLSVELDDGDFLKVREIVRNNLTANVVLRGWRFQRNKDVNNFLSRQINEICWMIEIDQDDARPPEIQCMEAVDVNKVIRRRLIRMTNLPFPALSWREDQEDDWETVYEKRVLVCRWKFVWIFPTAAARMERKPWIEQALVRVKAEDCALPCQKAFAKPDDLSQAFRGETQKGGMSRDWLLGEKEFLRQESYANQGKTIFSSLMTPTKFWERGDPMQRGRVGRLICKDELAQSRMTNDDITINTTSSGQPSSPQKQRYTVLDCFCGGGGWSRAAIMAGLRVDSGFDFEKEACETYSWNFFGAKVYHLWANEYLELTEDCHFDIMVASPPCAPFSPVHTRQGQHDDRNTASLLAIPELLKKAKPRVMILEQTAGLINQHKDWFNNLIQNITSAGYSVRWRLIKCADYGLAQPRPRLFIIASCPGETLPPFPRPTHSANATSGLKAWRTINQAIEGIPEGWANHDVDSCTERNYTSFSGDKQANTICTTDMKRQQMYHPSGKRDFTMREFACLQDFTLCHKFADIGAANVRTQIGNAVGPVVGQKMLEEVKRCLMIADGLLT